MTYRTFDPYQAVEALAASTRRAILERLRHRPLPVGELAKGLPVSRPAVSQHLQVLKAAGLVREQRVGARHLYGINPEGLAALRAYVESFWQDTLKELKATAERQRRKRR